MICLAGQLALQMPRRGLFLLEWSITVPEAIFSLPIMSTFPPTRRSKVEDPEVDLAERQETLPIDPGRLVEEHQQGVWRYLRVLGCDPEEAADLTQETFLTVLQTPFDYYSRPAAAAYLRKVAYHRFISSRRRSGREIAVAEVEQIAVYWTKLVTDDRGEELLEALRKCLQNLTARARLALELRFREQRSRAEIAEQLKITEHGAKNLMQRAKQKLRDCIESKLI